MFNTRNNLNSGLEYFFPRWRVIEDPKNYRVDFYVKGDLTTSKLAEIDLLRPMGVEFRFNKMNILQQLFFDRTSWDIKK